MSEPNSLLFHVELQALIRIQFWSSINCQSRLL